MGLPNHDGWRARGVGATSLSAGVRRLLESGPVSAVVVRIGDPGSPSHLRLVVDLDVAAPSDFQFDIEGRWEPLQ